jgi:Flp pilus assembly protein TadD
VSFVVPWTWRTVSPGKDQELVANYQKSLEHYDIAIQLKPKLAEAYMYRGVLYTEMGRKVDAEADLAALQKLNPQLAKELAEVIKTGKEEDRFYGLSSKISG